MFKRIASGASVYGEYGCGQSTVWMATHTQAKIVAVDTDEQWINFVRQQTEAGQGRAMSLQWIDCGDLGKMGRPLTYEKRANFLKYATSIWEHPEKPDLVLVDGRFRVLCFLVSLKLAERGTTLIFDDYAHRKHYHVVEEFVSRAELCGAQCRFVVPDKTEVDLPKLDLEIERFLYVME